MRVNVGRLRECLLTRVGLWFWTVCKLVCLGIIPRPALWDTFPWLRGKLRMRPQGPGRQG